jgi:hypothetical protein
MDNSYYDEDLSLDIGGNGVLPKNEDPMHYRTHSVFVDHLEKILAIDSPLKKFSLYNHDYDVGLEHYKYDSGVRWMYGILYYSIMYNTLDYWYYYQ